jgi:putative addiction module component (TIGR02574 family)
MSSAEIFKQALALPLNDRASLVHFLIESLPDAPRVYLTEDELADELERRIEDVKSGKVPTFDASETMRRAREAIQQIRR